MRRMFLIVLASSGLQFRISLTGWVPVFRGSFFEILGEEGVEQLTNSCVRQTNGRKRIIMCGVGSDHITARDAARQ
jgi:hypothetical protein